MMIKMIRTPAVKQEWHSLRRKWLSLVQPGP